MKKFKRLLIAGGEFKIKILDMDNNFNCIKISFNVQQVNCLKFYENTLISGSNGKSIFFYDNFENLINDTENIFNFFLENNFLELKNYNIEEKDDLEILKELKLIIENFIKLKDEINILIKIKNLNKDIENELKKLILQYNKLSENYNLKIKDFKNNIKNLKPDEKKLNYLKELKNDLIILSPEYEILKIKFNKLNNK